MTNIAFEKESSYLEGKDDGIKLGIEQGIEKGIERGIDQKAREMAKGLMEDGVPVDIIAKRSGLTIEEILGLN